MDIVSSHTVQSSLAIVGGGRWAKVYLDVLSKMQLPYRLLVVARHNADQIRALQKSSSMDITVVSSVADLILTAPIQAAIVVNAARAHFGSAVELLRHRIPTLIEKPIATSLSDVEHLYQLAQSQGVALLPSFTFRHCSYLHNFANCLHSYRSNIESASLIWSDPIAEIRYGEQKHYDNSISLALDLMPHVWSIISTLWEQPLDISDSVKNCHVSRGGRLTLFDLAVGSVPCHVSLERESDRRRRVFTAQLKNGYQLALDFSMEPGVIRIGQESFSGDEQWDQSPRPIERQIREFLDIVGTSQQSGSFKIAAMQSIRLAESADKLLSAHSVALD